MIVYKNDMVEDLRGKLTGLLLADSEITELLCGKNEEYEKRDNILWSRLIPQDFVPGVVTKTGTHLLFDINENALYPTGKGLGDISPERTISVYSQFGITFWTVTHRSAPVFNDRLRNDAVCTAVKRVLMSDRVLAPGGVHLISDCVTETGSKEHTGRRIRFVMSKMRADKKQKTGLIDFLA